MNGTCEIKKNIPPHKDPFKLTASTFFIIVLGVLISLKYRVPAPNLSYSLHKATSSVEIRDINNSFSLVNYEKGCSKENLNNFLHSSEVRGFHILCFHNANAPFSSDPFLDENGKRKLKIRAYENGLESKRKSWTSEMTWKDFKMNMMVNIESKGISSPTWAIFTPHGEKIFSFKQEERLSSENDHNEILEKIISKKMILIVEGGVWFWPGVHIGFKRNIQLRSNISHTEKNNELFENGRERLLTIETLSTKPLVLSVQGFLSVEECDYINRMARPRVMQASTVSLTDNDRGKSASNWRTSESTTIFSMGNPMLEDFDDRIAGLTRIPKTHQEDYQVLRYSEGQKYDAHYDYFDMNFYKTSDELKKLTKNGRQNRFATVFFYLSDVEKGGETIFPKFNRTTEIRDFADCSKGLKVQPEKGKVIIFYNLLPSGEYDRFSLHGACPVQKGIKWASNKWIWNEPMNYVK